MKKNVFVLFVALSLVLAACGGGATVSGPTDVVVNPTPRDETVIVLEVHVSEGIDPETGAKIVYYQVYTDLCESGTINELPFTKGEGHWDDVSFNDFASDTISAECGGFNLKKWVSDSSRVGIESSQMSVLQFMK